MEWRNVMKYKNIIFDFGNVLATFNEEHILSQFCQEKSDFAVLKAVVFEKWQALDEGSIELSDYIKESVSKAPAHLKENVLDFFENWYKHLSPQIGRAHV